MSLPCFTSCDSFLCSQHQTDSVNTASKSLRWLILNPPPASSLSLLQSQWVLCVPWLHQTSPASGFCPCRALCPILSTRLTYIPTLSLCSRVTWPWSDLSELLTSLTKSDPLLAPSSSMLAPVATATLHLSPVCYFLFHPLDCKFHDGSHCFIHHVA